jgi:uncharacterized protein YcgI (DUF1989 family)
VVGYVKKFIYYHLGDTMAHSSDEGKKIQGLSNIKGQRVCDLVIYNTTIPEHDLEKELDNMVAQGLLKKYPLRGENFYILP